MCCISRLSVQWRLQKDPRDFNRKQIKGETETTYRDVVALSAARYELCKLLVAVEVEGGGGYRHQHHRR